MDFYLFSVLSECQFSENGVKKFLGASGNQRYVVFINPESSIPVKNISKINLNLGRQVMRFLSKGMAVEVITLSGKKSLDALRLKLNEIMSHCGLSNEKKELMNALTGEENRILYYLLSGMKPIEISREMQKPLFMIYASKYEIYEKLRITKNEKLISFFDKIILLVLI